MTRRTLGPFESVGIIIDCWDDVLDPPKIKLVGGGGGKAGSKPPVSLEGVSLHDEFYRLTGHRHPTELRRYIDEDLLTISYKLEQLALRMQRVAKPEEKEGVFIGSCVDCHNKLYWPANATVLICHGCGKMGSRRAWARWMEGMLPETMTTVELAAFLSSRLEVEIKPTAVRTWATRKHIESVGKDFRGRSLYEPFKVLEWARAKGEKLHLPKD